MKQSKPADSSNALRIPAEAMWRYMPGDNPVSPQSPDTQDVVLHLFIHRSIAEPILVPAVAEPLLVMVLAGSAIVEEREPGGAWKQAEVCVGDFFLTSTTQPYEMRWQATNGDSFEVMHLYLAPALIDNAARDLALPHAAMVSFVDVSGGRDEWVRLLLERLRSELLDSRPTSQLLVHSLAQALAIHLVRNYRAPPSMGRFRNALPTYKLRRVIELMTERLAQDFSLAALAQAAQLSEYHFSRLFKRATGLSPSHYFIRLRMAHARKLLLETDHSVIDIGLEVGYSSPSHFSQVFRREVGVTPSAYRSPERS